MTDGPQPPPYPPGESRPPFDPFVLEPQKAHMSTGSVGSQTSFEPFAQEAQMAHHSTSSGPPDSMQRSRGFRIPPAFLGLLLALAVAVPIVIATLPQSGQAPSGDAAAPQRPADPVAPPPAGREPADPAAPLPAIPPGSQELQAVEDCAASLPGLQLSCETVLGGDPGAAALYLDCREVGAAAERCLSVLRDE